MSAPILNTKLDCGCGPDNINSSSEPCCDCRPKMILTYEEEAILKKLRDIKAKVRPIAETLKGVEMRRFDRKEPDPTSLEGEWIRLSGELDELRSAWNEWEVKLENAIEHKWILLGHREPLV